MPRGSPVDNPYRASKVAAAPPLKTANSRLPVVPTFVTKDP